MYEGWTVPIEYDPLLAKLVGYGETREQAIQRLERALYEYFVGGIKTNISLFRRILKDPDFRAGNIDTGFLERLLANKGHGAQSASRADCDRCGGNLRHHGSEGNFPRRRRTACPGQRRSCARTEQLAPRRPRRRAARTMSNWLQRQASLESVRRLTYERYCVRA